MNIYINIKDYFFHYAILSMIKEITVGETCFYPGEVKIVPDVQEADISITELSVDGDFFQCVTLDSRTSVAEHRYDICFYDNNNFSTGTFIGCQRITNMVNSRDLVENIRSAIINVVQRQKTNSYSHSGWCIYNKCNRHLSCKETAFMKLLKPQITFSSISSRSGIPIKTIYSRKRNIMKKVGIIRNNDFYKLVMDIQKIKGEV